MTLEAVPRVFKGISQKRPGSVVVRLQMNSLDVLSLSVRIPLSEALRRLPACSKTCAFCKNLGTQDAQREDTVALMALTTRGEASHARAVQSTNKKLRRPEGPTKRSPWEKP